MNTTRRFIPEDEEEEQAKEEEPAKEEEQAKEDEEEEEPAEEEGDSVMDIIKAVVKTEPTSVETGSVVKTEPGL